MSVRMNEFVVDEGTTGLDLDQVMVQRAPQITRRVARRLILEGQVLLNGAVARRNRALKLDDRVAFALREQDTEGPRPEAMALVIVYEDDELLVVDKPAGLVVHPSYRHPSGTLFNGLLAHALGSDVLPRYRPGLAHRLDKDTSGLLIVTKSAKARTAIQRQFDQGRVHKSYLALVDGCPDEDSGVIDLPLARDPADRRRVIVALNGHPAQTHWKVVERFAHHALHAVTLQTGRTHQIRAHLKAIGNPIVGDPTYGVPALGLHRPFLHAYRLEFDHPTNGTRIFLEAELPSDLRSYRIELGGDQPTAP
jgi:23S rRNA pseudouridine1911/1915/1917 synthase